MKKFKNCIYHYPYLNFEPSECLPPDAHRPIPIECKKCTHFLDFQSQEMIQKVSGIIQSGFYLPQKELPEVKGLVIMLPNKESEDEYSAKKQEIMFEAGKNWQEQEDKGNENIQSVKYRTRLEIEGEVKRICKESGINYKAQYNATAAQTIFSLLKKALEELKTKPDTTIGKFQELHQSLSQHIMNTDELKQILDLRKSFGTPLEEHAEGVAQIYIIWRCCRKQENLKEQYWESSAEMVKELGGKYLHELIQILIKIRTWSNMDFYRRSSRKMLAG